MLGSGLSWCCMTRFDKNELMGLAHSLNNRVEVYEAHISSREYALVFENVA